MQTDRNRNPPECHSCAIGILTPVDLVAITGIVVSGLLGPSVAAIWVQRNQRARFKQELVLHDRAELRDLVDELAQALERADIGARLAYGATTPAAEKEADERLRTDFDSVMMLKERLATRLGMNHRMVESLVEALNELRWVSMWWHREDAKADPGRTDLLYAMERYGEHRRIVLGLALPLVGSYIDVH